MSTRSRSLLLLSSTRNLMILKVLHVCSLFLSLNLPYLSRAAAIKLILGLFPFFHSHV